MFDDKNEVWAKMKNGSIVVSNSDSVMIHMTNSISLNDIILIQFVW